MPTWLIPTIAICVAVFNVLLGTFLGVVVWMSKRWVEKVDRKLDAVGSDILEIKMKGAASEGAQNTQFAVVSTEVRHMAERLAKLEGSNKRLWTKVDPEPVTGRE